MSVARTVFEWLPESARESIVRRRAELRGLGQMKANVGMLAMRLSELERGGPSGAPADAHVLVDDDRFPPVVRSRLCTQDQLSERWFSDWCEVLGQPKTAHRKTWEFAYVPEVLDALGLLRPGARGVGFGVGREALVAAFAARGVDVTATDLEPESREALGWQRSNQHASDVEAFQRPDICDPDVLRQRVAWRPVDMRAIPDDLRGYDFCWSTCALEHLGTLDDGLTFIERSLDALVPGGIAVHTTEFNLGSDDHTIEQGPTVVYRRRDMVALGERLEREGHQVAAFDFWPGSGLLDRYVDVPPYSDEPCLRFHFAGLTMTSIAVVIRKAS